MHDTAIIYEQPLDELIRLCLRLEHLFDQLDYHRLLPQELNSRAAIAALLDILNVIERPDLKAKLVKALSHHANILSSLEHSPDVDKNKLNEALGQLDNLIDVLHTKPGRIGQPLKDNEFLATIRQRLSIPAGDCNFNLPGYHRWLSQPQAQRMNELHQWTEHYTHLKAATYFLLKLTRESALPHAVRIEDGFYQQNLESNNAWQLVRVAIPYEAGIYPEFSVGQHRLSVRLQKLNAQGRPQAHMEPLTCALTLCSRQIAKG